ncbi:MAG: hypothetical protein ACRBB6_04425 [Neptuniibacter sp.]
MGLDQYWFLEKTKEEKMKDLITNENTENDQIGYHRKWYHLNEFMGEQYPDDVGEYNCVDLVISIDIVESLELWIKRYTYSRAYTEDEFSEAEEFQNSTLPLIRKYVEEGRTVIYHPWW